MKIGFDAKRAYHNNTGLGNYSRTLIRSLANLFPTNNYFLFNPKQNNQHVFPEKNIQEINPTSFLSKLFPSFWRSRWMANEIEKKVDIYHGLSNELPWSLLHKKCKTIVTIHDLIFEHYPEQYSQLDVFFYKNKFKFACQSADRIIAISEATKQDILNTYTKIDPTKIEVCYQSCDARFFLENKKYHRDEYIGHFNLPNKYFIYVGSIIERKNLLSICKAMKLFNKEEDVQLVVIGKGSAYKQQVKSYLVENQLENLVIFLEDIFDRVQIFDALPFLYHFSTALIYPSIMEGFGIPVLEAMASGTAVITSNCSSLKEAGGDAAILIDPNNSNDIFNAMKKLNQEDVFRANCIEKGLLHANHFTNEKCAAQVMQVYHKMMLK